MSNIWDKLDDKPYQIKIGNSIKSKNISYHSIHYNIKPPSIDHNKPGALHCNDPKTGMYVLEYNNQQNEEKYQFIGNQKEANKELILLYDEATNTITLERLDSMFIVKRDGFKKERSALSEPVEHEPIDIFESIALPPITKSTKLTTKATTKSNTNANSIPNDNTNTNTNNNESIQDTFDDDSVEEFDLGSDKQEETNIEDPFSAFEKMRAESAKAKENKSKLSAKQQPPKYTNSSYNDDDNLIKEVEENIIEETEKEIEEFSLENEFEQELEKAEEDDEDEEKFSENDNDLEEEIVDTLELSSSEEDSDDMSPSNKRRMNQNSPGAKRPKPDVHDGPISLSAFAGNDEEDEESSDSSSSDDD
ncbi:hypothetical protein LY90DRAFT_669288 [Neocallimastix californiae]|uniref:Transcription elongation factor Eaf N-terminal domain-containing protein n=1 Tax=Neocallimastix californiae TaxID=1754190 RepID=A0A1Y2DBS0_9FUNG|nr:hypothetical protein LY90DRAFT_669288 [Neocallimastix californiae]|eukprot:ORY56723.1 hypothetical protein LY90DRAFT_669288 [Neocallimastix californiae]